MSANWQKCKQSLFKMQHLQVESYYSYATTTVVEKSHTTYYWPEFF